MADEETTQVDGWDSFLNNKPEDAATDPVPVTTDEPTVVEPEAQTSETQAPETQTADQKFFELVNKHLSTGYQSDEEVSEAFRSLAKTADYDIKVKEATEFKSKVDEYTAKEKAWAEEKAKLEAKVNPLAFFRDEKAYVAEQLRRQFPDKDPSVIEKVVTSDLTKMDKLDVLAYGILMDTPDIEGGLEGAREAALSDLGVEAGSSPEEWDRTTKNKLAIKANQARQHLEEQYQRQVEIPKVRTEEELQAEMATRIDGLKKAWTPYLEKMEAIDKLQIPAEDGTVLATIDIPAEWRKEMRDEMVEAAVAVGEPNEQTLAQLNTAREMKFIHKNFPKLATILLNQERTRLTEEFDKKLNNTEPPNTAVRPDALPDDSDVGILDFLDKH